MEINFSIDNNFSPGFVEEHVDLSDAVAAYCGGVDATLFWLLLSFWFLTVGLYVLRERGRPELFDKLVGVYFRFFIVLVGYGIYLLWLRI